MNKLLTSYILFSLILGAFYPSTIAAQQYAWTQKASLPASPRYEAVAFTIAGKGYYGTGANFSISTVFNDFWEYDPALNAWSQKASVPGSFRYGAVGFEINGRGYVGTGWTANSTQLFDFY
mgnify:CR=1 FL=1